MCVWTSLWSIASYKSPNRIADWGSNYLCNSISLAWWHIGRNKLIEMSLFIAIIIFIFCYRRWGNRGGPSTTWLQQRGGMKYFFIPHGSSFAWAPTCSQHISHCWLPGAPWEEQSCFLGGLWPSHPEGSLYQALASSIALTWRSPQQHNNYCKWYSFKLQ